MLTTAGKVRELLAAMSDDAPVFADVWTAATLVPWIEGIEDAAKDDGEALYPIDLANPDTLRRVLQCLPFLWDSYDAASEEFQSNLIQQFKKGGAS
jgi:hypothetical protein